ncbi:MAG: DNA polymerase III subunit beta [Candidatus Liptonbacteria bacterium]|nr:DNA polymerase III subunit beta [Candidatus Liptonbacteria bacterium]
MKAVALREAIMEGIAAVSRAAGGDTLPILKSILIEANNNKLTLVGTNLEIAIQYGVSGKVIENGKITVPARAFGEVLSVLRSERVNLEQKGQSIALTSDNYRASFQSLSAEDFPIIPKIKNTEKYIECKAEVLKDALGGVLIATEFSDLRPELNSVSFRFTPQLITLAATDSFRLAEQQIPSTRFSSNIGEEFQILIPLKTSQELLRLIKEGENVKIYVDDNQILFTTPNAECISRLVEGRFPEYSAIIPASFESELTVGKEDLIEALKLASVFHDRASEVRLVFSKDQKAVEISSSSQGVGENVYMLPAKIQGENGEVLFNGRYVHDMLRVARGGELFIGLNDEHTPALFRSVGDASYQYIVKPILKT